MGMNNSGCLTLRAVGDLALHAQYDELSRKYGPEWFFSGVSPLLRQSDLTFGNLESVLSSLGSPNTAKRLCLRGNPVFVKGLASAGFTVVSLANNHSFDFGADAYCDMRASLEDSGISAVGGGENLAAARRPLFVEHNGVRLLFLAYSAEDTNGFNEATGDTPGVALLKPEAVKEDIASHQGKADCIIVSLHWGEEFNHYPTPEQVLTARQIIDAGAKIVLGHHAHVLQGIERYRGGVIAYNLGSLMMSGPSGDYRYVLQENNRESVILMIHISKDGISDVEITPTRLDENLRPNICEGIKRDEVLGRLDKWSETVADPGYPEFWREMVIRNRFRNPVREWLGRGNYLGRAKNLRPGDIRRPFDFLRSYLGMRFRRF